MVPAADAQRRLFPPIDPATGIALRLLRFLILKGLSMKI
jgi:hypothetical protein